MHQKRDRRALIAAIGLSSFGDELAIVALALRVESLTGSPTAVALLFIVSVLPHILFAPLAGWLTDRRETVQTLRWFSFAQAAIAAALAFAGSLPLVFVLAFALGAFASVTSPSVFALVPLLDEGSVAKTNSSIEIAKYAGWIAGPFVAGVVAEQQGTAAPLLIDAATFLVLALGTFSLSVRRLPVPTEEEGKGGARAGFAYVARDRSLLLLFVVVGAIVLFAVMDNVAELFFARDTLGQPQIGYGVLASTWMVGMVIGGLIARRVTGPAAARWIVVSSIVGGAAVAVAALSGALLPAATLFVVGGAGNGLLNVAARTLVHERAPAALHGRVFAAYVALVTTTQIGATALGGVLVGAIGGQEALLIGGVGTAVVGLLGLIGLAFARAGGSNEDATGTHAEPAA